ncbi:hypothetical protein L1887_28863 [Cichorium endivia]|nr:hypothetical protein L1887_28863 [Cichorium endivia]
MVDGGPGSKRGSCRQLAVLFPLGLPNWNAESVISSTRIYSLWQCQINLRFLRFPSFTSPPLQAVILKPPWILRLRPSFSLLSPIRRYLQQVRLGFFGLPVVIPIPHAKTGT